MLLSSASKRVFPYSSTTNRLMNHAFSLNVSVSQISAIAWARRVGLFKGYSAIVSLFPFSFISNYLLTLLVPECFTTDFYGVDFAFPNVIFPTNINNAPFPGSVPVAFFVTKLAGESVTISTAWCALSVRLQPLCIVRKVVFCVRTFQNCFYLCFEDR